MNDRPNPRVLPLVLLCTVTLWATGFGCGGCGVEPIPDGGDASDDASVDSGQDASVDSGQDSGTNDGGQDASVDGGPDASFPTDGGCGPSGAACTVGGAACCSDNCNNGVCGPQIFCAPSGLSCTSNTECCSGHCNGGTCDATQCLFTGETCASDLECCSGDCAGNACAATPSGSTCHAVNDVCDGGSQCCSSNCQAGQCQKASSCLSENDVCFRNEDCCSFVCSSTDGVNGGHCIWPSGTPNCRQVGTPCTSGNNCCTNVCSDPGSGVKVCQGVTGCRVSGDPCSNSLECCGGLGTPGGTVECRPANDKCDLGTACNERGEVCGKPVDSSGNPVKLPDGGDFTVNANTNCCNGINLAGGYDWTCRLDSSGVPRCWGQGDAGTTTCPSGLNGDPGCCIQAGDFCDFSDQCCSGVPCLADDAGIRRCTIPQCVPLGSSCTPGGSGADACCTGTCTPLDEVGLTNACLTQTQGDAGGCTVNDAGCANSSECCSGICNGTKCVPDICQGTDATCQSSADCCSGLSCVIPGGQTLGTCQSGASCPQAGQSCAPSKLCCGEGTSLTCLSDTTGLGCDGTTSCTCSYIIGKAPVDTDYSWQ